MTPLASVADVKRALHRDESDTSIDGPLEDALESAISVMTRYLRQDFAAEAASTATYFNVHDHTYIPLPVEGATITAVRFYRTQTSTPYLGITPNDYEIQDGRIIRLHPVYFDVPFEGAVSSHLTVDWSRIEVDFTPTGNVPAPVRDATAITAASIYVRSPIAAKGLTGETIGDYSYQFRPTKAGGSSTELIPDMAKDMVKGFRRRRSLVP